MKLMYRKKKLRLIDSKSKNFLLLLVTNLTTNIEKKREMFDKPH